MSLSTPVLAHCAPPPPKGDRPSRWFCTLTARAVIGNGIGIGGDGRRGARADRRGLWRRSTETRRPSRAGQGRRAGLASPPPVLPSFGASQMPPEMNPRAPSVASSSPQRFSSRQSNIPSSSSFSSSFFRRCLGGNLLPAHFDRIILRRRRRRRNWPRPLSPSAAASAIQAPFQIC